MTELDAVPIEYDSELADEPLWTIDNLATYLQVPVKTLRHWRLQKIGPPVIPLPGRHLRWRRADVMQWLEAQR